MPSPNEKRRETYSLVSLKRQGHTKITSCRLYAFLRNSISHALSTISFHSNHIFNVTILLAKSIIFLQNTLTILLDKTLECANNKNII